jgi:Tol biopolymer transport system component
MAILSGTRLGPYRVLPLLAIVAIGAFLRSPVSGQAASLGTIIYERFLKGDNSPTSSPDIYLTNADGTNNKALTTDGKSHFPILSPDGKQILFLHDAGLLPTPHGWGYVTELFVMDRDGGVRRLLRRFNTVPAEPTTSDMITVWASWSHDGKMLAVSGWLYDPSNEQPFGLFLFPVSGQGKEKLLSRTVPFYPSYSEESLTPLWSPDGKTIAFSARAGTWSSACGLCQSSEESIHIIRADGSGDTQLTSPGLDRADPAAWSPDGKRIYAVIGGSNVPGLSALDSTVPPGDREGRRPAGGARSIKPFVIHLINADGSSDTPITPADRNSLSPAVSPDGRRIAFDSSTHIFDSEIFVANQDGSGARQVTRDPDWFCGNPSWSPDGNQIAFSCRLKSATCPEGVHWGGKFQCVRRMFAISLDNPPVKLVPIIDHDGVFPSFAPLR